MRIILILTSLLLSFISMAVPPATGRTKLVIDKTRSTATYTMKHPMHIWDGVSRDVNGAMIYNTDTKQMESVAIVIKVASFDTKNANRDSHAIEVLEGIKYPTVSFTAQDIRPNADGTLAVTGKLTFHGISKPLTVQATRQETNDGFRIDGTFPVSLTDFQIEKPSLMMVPVEDVMALKFSLVFKGTTPLVSR
jgi:polyisoprenoid-binding protein YceI